MAPITKTLALAGALFALTGIAAPVEKRAVVWETVTDVVWTTVDVTTTIYPNQGKPTATATVVAVTTPVAAVETTSSAAPVEEEAKAAPTTSTTEAPAPVAQPTEKATVQAQNAAAAPAVESSSSSSSSTTTTAAAAVQTAQRSTDTSSTGTSSSSGATHSGQATYYDTATLASNPSSCGTTNDGETEAVLALPVGLMTDSDCGKTVTISYLGTTTTGTCMGCDDGSIDLSRKLFGELANLSAGRLDKVTWSINN
ncbi:hypothetical protein N7509_003118 [Penicillium cosmopolitanum]|uniref:Allergen Asp f 7 n=1 Tax=Penicillium cosmopolitanum TaxID=1131564 RepID=A0A9W9W4I7_9EURO|nr:uncharacterized protein N7509_003118 [Penicillium cosmopolitanum]KAJ5403247.1 hypothetical protein N7509_003118 [Penicillium cosmopolitanum]